ncbi:arf-GAP with Rho-GAP ANK repeat and PH domain-containing 1-like protein [Labeo rohita]|uniref:Arf-GAP with Rho-GAP ANK repeat and PH domain-containing 1-like protein n=1 Tax=Labeo rohita TaxID=84645 RepID=A0A498NK52_LABRO|nr:arf-GAP with Rho-GAP ANK repeat and PH domain-containing 1-like protein [Labeo rohita]
MQKCFINLKAEEDRKETVNWREREDSIDIQCTDFPDFSEDFRQIVKAGWLEKTPPKGGKIYQRRWVQLDSEYLRYFQSIKEVYSKRMVSLGSVDKVVSVGDLRFELRSQSRTFLFRAESTQERNDWVCCIEKILSDRKQHLEPRNLFFRNGSVNISFEGYMEMLSPRTKVYTLISKDKLFIFKSHEEYFQGVGITDIDMRMANVRDGENKRSFTLTTPYRAFSSSMPEWASINLCVLLCEKCAGAHRSLGQNVSKVRSLKLDERVWTDDLIRVFLLLGNGKANQFWGANIPPSESLCSSANSEKRLEHITAKYKDGKYRKYHILYGQQEALNSALCSAVQSGDLLETLSLLNCGADINCNTGIPELPTPLSLAKRSSQTVQAELLMQNLSTESFTRVDKDVSIRSQCGYLFKTASSARPITDHKTKAGLMSSGIYRKSGINSRVTKLLERFQNDARSVTMLESDYSVDDMANTLKRFLREVKDGVFNGQENSDSWLRAAGLKDRGEKVHRYQILLSNLPEVNRETLKALIHHLVCVQHLSDENQMTIRNLGIVFGPTLFQTDGKDVTGSQVVEELIQNYCSIFNVSESDLQRQLNMTSEILNKHKSQIAADMTVVKLVSVVLELKGIQQANEEFWSCYEVLEKEEMEDWIGIGIPRVRGDLAHIKNDGAT